MRVRRIPDARPPQQADLFIEEFETPAGRLRATVDAGGTLVRLNFCRKRARARKVVRAAACAPIRRQLTEYFEGRRTAFDLPLAPPGTAFQRRVWAELVKIPYGARSTYGELARKIGSPAASRAVGAANGANPIAIVIPCHRVVGSDGSLTGYGGGLPLKQWLLAHEAGARPLF